jgi:hypothetical protein
VDIVLISVSSFVCLEAVIRRDAEIHRSIGLPRDRLDRRLDLDQEVIAVVPIELNERPPVVGAFEARRSPFSAGRSRRDRRR